MDNGFNVDCWLKPELKKFHKRQEKKKHRKFCHVTKQWVEAPSLATRQRVNRANKQCLEDRNRAALLKQNEIDTAAFDVLVKAGQAIARWTPDPKAIARKKKAIQDKSMAMLRALRSRAGRRKATRR